MIITLTILSALVLAAAIYTDLKRPAKAVVPVRVETVEQRRLSERR